MLKLCRWISVFCCSLGCFCYANPIDFLEIKEELYSSEIAKEEERHFNLLCSFLPYNPCLFFQKKENHFFALKEKFSKAHFFYWEDFDLNFENIPLTIDLLSVDDSRTAWKTLMRYWSVLQRASVVSLKKGSHGLSFAEDTFIDRYLNKLGFVLLPGSLRKLSGQAIFIKKEIYDAIF